MVAYRFRGEDDVRDRLPKARRAGSVTVVHSLFDFWERELPRISGKSKLAEAIRCVLDDRRVEIDANIAERAIQPQATTRGVLQDLSGKPASATNQSRLPSRVP
jgi:hypothetical protein